MTGNTPQPGETPADNPWARTDPLASWWRGEQEPTSRDWADLAADEARTAGSDDATQQLHAPEQGERLTTAAELMIIEPGLLGLPERSGEDDLKIKDDDGGTYEPAPAVPEAVVLPEPDGRNRPTVVLDQHPRPPRGPLPPLPPPPLPPPPPPPLPPLPLPPLPQGGVSPAVATRLERVENSPFWETDEARIAAEARHDPRSGRRRRQPDANPVTAMLALIALGLVASFFAWVSAEPFWLAVGHGDPGYATTTGCRGDGITQHCSGRFAAADGRFTAGRVTLLGISGSAREPGAVSGARMVSRGSTQAYAAPPGLRLHLRWVLGFLLVLICGYGIAGATGARRLESRRARRAALLGSVAGPVLLLLGFLISAY